MKSDEDLDRSQNHKMPIEMVLWDQDLESKNKCEYDEFFKSFIVNRIKQKKQKRISRQCYLKTNFLLQIDQLIGNTHEWIKHLNSIGFENLQYNFYEELEKQIKKFKVQELNLQSLIDQIIKVNQQWYQKIFKKLVQMKTCEVIEKCQQQLSHIETINSYIFSGEIQLKLIDDKVKQQKNCYQIVFDNSGQIMVSNSKEEIKIWNIMNGTFKLLNTFMIHKRNINCLLYSKYVNNFISCSDDSTISCWKQITQIIGSGQNHLKIILIRFIETQLFSGGHDSTIKIWNFDFQNNNLTYIYSLNGHKNGSYSITLNDSETVLASCGYENLVIWEKGSQGEWIQNDTKLESTGWNIKFINDSQLFQISDEQKINDIKIYEKIDGEFKPNKQKSISLVRDSQFSDNAFSSIIYNKEKNIILIRKNEYFYIIRKQINGKFQVAGQLKCETSSISGTLTNDAKYLIFWDEKQQKYLSYEIINL
ncbi:unnamed protein product [Paramecium sonneborni]|uniref:WD40-repeat-containing domain n=1 Tax=Paramecium sonneborni TaxID=65129 RepID=A0A8S1N2G9_9CILI|nr:unnamed protein product [Paramecium sonneborni]